MTTLPPNVYRVRQRDFDAIPGAPWVYWVPERVRRLFRELPKLEDVAEVRLGMTTGDNTRFVRYWWEVGQPRIAFGCHDAEEAQASGQRWFPYMKGGGYCAWYGNQEHVVNWAADGLELLTHSFKDGRPRCFARNAHSYFREGVTYSFVSSSGFAVRLSPGGFIFDVAGSSLFASDGLGLIGVLNSSPAGHMLGNLNPTINYQVGDLKRLPIPVQKLSDRDETTYDFILPWAWGGGPGRFEVYTQRLTALEAEIDALVHQLYGLDPSDLADAGAEAGNRPAPEPPDASELAARWISYAIGIVLGRFRPGQPGALGSAVFRREDFAVGSLPAPDLDEFDALVGPADAYAYVDAQGGRHAFSRDTERELAGLALADGLAVLDQGHPRDLVDLVRRALDLMLGPDATDAIIADVPHGDLRRYLSGSFWTREHYKWYHKRPVYWPLQTEDGRTYGLVLFHERVHADTLYALARNYVDPKANGLRQAMARLRGRLEGLSGSAAREVEKELADARDALAQVEAFGAKLQEVASQGYTPDDDWIDDGVILRLAPLWELVPTLGKEARKYWERLQKGEYDWSHIAMRYWPDRVREACREQKSYAIAHRHPEWYQGEI